MGIETWAHGRPCFIWSIWTALLLVGSKGFMAHQRGRLPCKLVLLELCAGHRLGQRLVLRLGEQWPVLESGLLAVQRNKLPVPLVLLGPGFRAAEYFSICYSLKKLLHDYATEILNPRP